MWEVCQSSPRQPGAARCWWIKAHAQKTPGKQAAPEIHCLLSTPVHDTTALEQYSTFSRVCLSSNIVCNMAGIVKPFGKRKTKAGRILHLLQALLLRPARVIANISAGSEDVENTCSYSWSLTGRNSLCLRLTGNSDDCCATTLTMYCANQCLYLLSIWRRI